MQSILHGQAVSDNLVAGVSPYLYNIHVPVMSVDDC